MKDYTAVFASAASAADCYEPKAVNTALNLFPDLKCFVDDDCAKDDWFTIFDSHILYGYLHCRYPLALLKTPCPAYLLDFFQEHRILYTEPEEPMCCDETVLRKYVSSGRIIDARFLDSCNYSYEDERFLKFLKKLETGKKTISTHPTSYFRIFITYKERNSIL